MKLDLANSNISKLEKNTIKQHLQSAGDEDTIEELILDDNYLNKIENIEHLKNLKQVFLT